MKNKKHFLNFLINILRREINTLNNKIGKSVEYTNKKKGTGNNIYINPVTKYDQLIELKILKLLDKYFPDHQISGEEFGQKFSNSKYKWVIDPIDGTKALICGQPTWSNLIGLIENDYPKMGLANFPILKKYYYSDSINSYCCNIKKKIIRTSKQTIIKKSKLITNSFHTFKSKKIFNFFKNYKFFFKISGVDAYNFCLLAEGKIDLVMESGLKPFDILPHVPIIENAGGVITDWKGNKNFEKGEILAAANKILHSKFLSYIKSKI